MAALTLLSRRSSSTALSHFRFTLNRFTTGSFNNHHQIKETPPKNTDTNTNTNTWRKFGDISGPLNSWPDYEKDLGPLDLGKKGDENFPGCDYKHWLIIMADFEERVSKEEMICRYIRTLAKVLGRYNHMLNGFMPAMSVFFLTEEMIDRPPLYIHTLANVLGSEEEARNKIYNIFTDRYFGFGCEIDEETSNKLEDLPGVMFAVPDCYVDAENKDYGAELVVNGKIVQRTLERQRRVEPVYP